MGTDLTDLLERIRGDLSTTADLIRKVSAPSQWDVEDAILKAARRNQATSTIYREERGDGRSNVPNVSPVPSLSIQVSVDRASVIRFRQAMEEVGDVVGHLTR